MNSKLKLLPAALLVSVLAMAGCGGGGSNDTASETNGTDDEATQVECGMGTMLNDAGDKCILDPSDQEREANKTAATEALTLHGKLDESTPATDVTTIGAQITLAGDDGEYMSDDGKVHIMAYSRKGTGEEGDPIKWGGGTGDGFATDAQKIVAGAENAKLVMLTSNMPDSDGSLKKYATGHKDVTGTFRGMSGRFTCSSETECAARKASEGYELVGPWAFAPSGGNDATFTVVTPDTDYAEYGWWIDEDSSVQVESDGIRTFVRFTSTSATAINDFLGVSGTATYEGMAAGQVAVHLGPESSDNVSGAFEADAMLVASFGTEDTISGTIDNFMVEGSSPGSWSVELMQSKHDGSAWGDAKTKWTMGDAAGTATGNWNVTLHEAGTTVNALKDPPKSAMGTFNSEYGTSGNMVGAFGAERQ
ncbi:MAG: hypothetical protein F4213_08995 [Boseongicola sp. SB0677_bin_26]|nr:hypothetical protein [Boseongicola sp. SB0665_bin_10]MYG26147.1 hypothetical protein [Boseongicola sp. SB0677_bin_26]